MKQFIDWGILCWQAWLFPSSYKMVKLCLLKAKFCFSEAKKINFSENMLNSCLWMHHLLHLLRNGIRLFFLSYYFISRFLGNYFTPGEISHNLKLAEATNVQILKIFTKQLQMCRLVTCNQMQPDADLLPEFSSALALPLAPSHNTHTHTHTHTPR